MHGKTLGFYSAFLALQSGFMAPVAIIGERVPLHLTENAISLKCSRNVEHNYIHACINYYQIKSTIILYITKPISVETENMHM